MTLDLLPFAGILAALASRRVGVWQAALAGLILSLPAFWFAAPDAQTAMARMAGAAMHGLWLSWLALSVILSGLLFHQVVSRARAGPAPTPEAASPERRYRVLFALCFLVGPFFESVTGFGVGLVVTLPLLLRLGITPVGGIVLGLYSQMLVPWGGMAVGTTVGAALAGLPLHTLGLASALLTVPLLGGYLWLFWRLAAAEGLHPNASQRLDDLLWIAALGGLLVLCNDAVAVPIAGLLATGLLLVPRHWRDQRPSLTQWRAAARSARPYLLVTGLLLVTHTLPPLRHTLEHLWVWQPVPGWPAFPPFYEVSFWLAVTALGYGLATRLDAAHWQALVADTGRMAWPPARTTVLFVVMAQLMSDGGIAGRLAAGWHAAAGNAALYAAPLLGGLAGLLTASNTASNALLMPLQTALAGGDPRLLTWLAAAQNLAGSNLTALSPIRIEMAVALAGLAGGTAHVYSRAWPLGALALLLLTAMLAVLVLG